jgi:hypothetical protein
MHFRERLHAKCRIFLDMNRITVIYVLPVAIYDILVLRDREHGLVESNELPAPEIMPSVDDIFLHMSAYMEAPRHDEAQQS